MEIRSPAKKQIMDFVRTTKLGEKYTFDFRGTEVEAEDFVKRMRTELSRLRRLVVQSGRKLSHFKVLQISLEQVSQAPPLTRVVLKKADNGTREIEEYLDADVIKELAGE